MKKSWDSLHHFARAKAVFYIICSLFVHCSYTDPILFLYQISERRVKKVAFQHGPQDKQPLLKRVMLMDNLVKFYDEFVNEKS